MKARTVNAHRELATTTLSISHRPPTAQSVPTPQLAADLGDGPVRVAEWRTGVEEMAGASLGLTELGPVKPGLIAVLTGELQ